MLPKIRVGYPVTIHGHLFTKVGIVCDTSTYAQTGILDVVYVDAAFKAWRSNVVWRETRFEWTDPSSPGLDAENDPQLESFVTTVKNGRY